MLAWEADSAARQSQTQRLRDSASSLLEQYAELLRGGRVEGEVDVVWLAFERHNRAPAYSCMHGSMHASRASA